MADPTQRDKVQTTRVNEIVALCERANVDEHGPLAEAGSSALYRSAQGLPISRISSESEHGSDEAAAFCRGVLAQLQAIDIAALDEQPRLSTVVLRAALERRLAAARYYWYVSPVTPYRSFVGAFRLIFRSFDVDSDEARTRYLSVLKDVAAFALAAKDKLAGQAARGLTITARALPPIIALHRAAAASDGTPFLPGTEKLAALDERACERLLRDARAVFQHDVSPALHELAEYIAGPYAHSACAAFGQSAYPGGTDYYAHAVRANTTLAIEPSAVHARGLAVMDELREAMSELRSRLGFHGTAQEFHRSLRADPRFVPTRPEQIGERLQFFAERADVALPALFLRKPAAPFSTKRLSPDLEPGMTFGYYEPGAKPGECGNYVYNGSKLAERSLLSVASLALHELVPGHHYEINLSRENEALPRFRAFQSLATYIPAYHEGWAEYAADLGKELGIYEDPYDLYGRHALDSFISSRLVVDTGVNALGWSFDRAAEYLRENTLLSEGEIESELLRYATDLPAQSLSYKIGSLKFAELRERVRSQLGAAFDVRSFHDRIVRNGGMPLDVLESETLDFISDQ